MISRWEVGQKFHLARSWPGELEGAHTMAAFQFNILQQNVRRHFNHKKFD